VQLLGESQTCEDAITKVRVLFRTAKVGEFDDSLDRLNHDCGTKPDAGVVPPPSGQPLMDRVITIAAMAGAVCGAVGGVALGAMVSSDHPGVYGALGTTLGSVLAALFGRFAVLPAWTAFFPRSTTLHEFSDPTQPR
jgi:hypothetical protein